MHLVFWMTWWIDTYRSKDTLTRWIVGARGFSGKTRVTARSNVSHFLSVGIQARGPGHAHGSGGQHRSYVPVEHSQLWADREQRSAPGRPVSGARGSLPEYGPHRRSGGGERPGDLPASAGARKVPGRKREGRREGRQDRRGPVQGGDGRFHPGHPDPTEPRAIAGHARAGARRNRSGPDPGLQGPRGRLGDTYAERTDATGADDSPASAGRGGGHFCSGAVTGPEARFSTRRRQVIPVERS